VWAKRKEIIASALEFTLPNKRNNSQCRDFSMVVRSLVAICLLSSARKIVGVHEDLDRMQEKTPNFRRILHHKKKQQESPFLALEHAEITPYTSPPPAPPPSPKPVPDAAATTPAHNSSAEVWHLYYANPRAASLFLSSRIDMYGSGRVRYEPRMFTEEAEAIFPKTGKRYHTSNGYVATKVMFLVPPPLYLDLGRQGREGLDLVIHDPRVIPIVAANEFCEGFFHFEDWPAPALKQYWDGDEMARSGLALYSAEEQKRYPTVAAWGDRLWGSGEEDARAALQKDQATPWYLPLGPRYEFRIVQPEEVKPPTGRRFLFNMMTSLSTNTVRIALDATVRSFVLEEETGGLSSVETRAVDNKLPLGYPSSRLLPRIGEAFVHNTQNWAANLPTAIEQGQALPSEKYRDVLLDSVFTLSPSGHNPETFRLYEAAEAGSIPIVDYTGHGTVVDDDGGGGRSGSECGDPWRPFLDSGAPFIWVEDWTGLEALLETLRSDPEALAKRQAELLAWLKAFMRGAVGSVEQAMSSHKALHALESSGALPPSASRTSSRASSSSSSSSNRHRRQPSSSSLSSLSPSIAGGVRERNSDEYPSSQRGGRGGGGSTSSGRRSQLPLEHSNPNRSSSSGFSRGRGTGGSSSKQSSNHSGSRSSGDGRRSANKRSSSSSGGAGSHGEALRTPQQKQRKTLGSSSSASTAALSTSRSCASTAKYSSSSSAPSSRSPRRSLSPSPLRQPFRFERRGGSYQGVSSSPPLASSLAPEPGATTTTNRALLGRLSESSCNDSNRDRERERRSSKPCSRPSPQSRRSGNGRDTRDSSGSFNNRSGNKGDKRRSALDRVQLSGDQHGLSAQLPGAATSSLGIEGPGDGWVDRASKATDRMKVAFPGHKNRLPGKQTAVTAFFSSTAAIHDDGF